MKAANLIKLSSRATCDTLALKRKPSCFPSCQDGSQPVETVPSYYSKSGGGSIGAHNRWSYKRGSGAIKTPSSIRKVAAKRAFLCRRPSIRRGDIFDELSASARKTNDANRRARKRGDDSPRQLRFSAIFFFPPSFFSFNSSTRVQSFPPPFLSSGSAAIDSPPFNIADSCIDSACVLSRRVHKGGIFVEVLSPEIV